MEEKELYIIKIGTNALIKEDGSIRDFVLSEIFLVTKKLINAGNNVVIITSGAVRMGRNFLNNEDISKPVAAGVGQPLLFNFYKEEASKNNLKLAELLLTRSSIIKRDSLFLLQKVFHEIYSSDIIPIVNENDAFSYGTDLSFGDNDGLASVLAVILKAKKLIIISNIDGLFDSDPSKNKNAKLIKDVTNVSDEFLKFCSNNASANGSGGMFSKLKAARICSAVGIDTYVINGLVNNNLISLFEEKNVGTHIHGRNVHSKISNKDRWILAAKSSSGSIQIDSGAVAALMKGKSLLAVGVKKVYGEFSKNEVIELINEKKSSIAFGIVDIAKDDIELILKTRNTHDQRIIHANNLFILK
jgi:glutamate 5-kinase